ncbi:MAG: SAM-dependent methyltransferase [Gammaproteobacteria bacterium]|nr:SAM-dependent methyltransferase [Gammaproteobacteria bacterium]
MLISREPPALTADEAAHSARVAAHLQALLRGAGGWLPFSRFMDAALYAPGLGYYMAGAARFGPGGDFVTAPELSPLFARCLARQLAQILGRTGGGDIVEYGAGSGRLAADLLPALAELGVRPHRYRIVEVSAALRAAQRATLQGAGAAGDIEWLDEPPATGWRGVVLANEVLDALPVERFQSAGTGCLIHGVVAAGAGFAWQARPASADLSAAVAAIAARLPEAWSDDYQSELRPMLPAWVATVTASLECGALLAIDYGLPRAQYYHPSRAGGTLCGFFRHYRIADVLARPGLQDLTAWVDFSAVAEAAAPAGLEVAGFATQAHFLAALGIDELLARAFAAAPPRQQHALAQGVATLMLPGEMGERFKVIALTRGVPGPLAGFGFRDLAASL